MSVWVIADRIPGGGTIYLRPLLPLRIHGCDQVRAFACRPSLSDAPHTDPVQTSWNLRRKRVLMFTITKRVSNDELFDTPAGRVRGVRRSFFFCTDRLESAHTGQWKAMDDMVAPRSIIFTDKS